MSQINGVVINRTKPTSTPATRPSVVVVTSNERELQMYSSAIRALKFKDVPIVCVRYGANTAAAQRELGQELKKLGILQMVTATIGVSTTSVEDALADKGFCIDIFLGRRPQYVDKTKAIRDQIEDNVPRIKVRYACVCRKCESVISESFSLITRKQANVEGGYQYPGATETKYDSYHNRYNAYSQENTCSLC